MLLTPPLAEALRARQESLACALVGRQYALQPEWAQRFGAAGRQHCLDDAKIHLGVLAAALGAQAPCLFLDYVAWAKVMLERRGIGEADLASHLVLLRAVLLDGFGDTHAQPAALLVVQSIASLSLVPHEPASFLDPTSASAELAQDYLDLTMRGQRRLASERVLAAVAGGASVATIYQEVLERCQREIGRLWQINAISVAQEHYTSAVTQMTMSQLYPTICAGEPARKGVAVATCAAGDLHEIGLRMVADLLEQDGWEVAYLGANTPALAVRQMLLDRQAQLLLISASQPPRLPAIQSLIDLVRSAPDCSAVRILVGGHPFNSAPGLWQRMGADGHAASAQEAVGLARTLEMRVA